MATFTDLTLPYNGQTLTDTINANFALTNSTRTVLTAQNNTTQFLATPVGTVESISYGTASVEDTVYITLTGAGTIITFVTAGLYFVEFKLQVDRTSAAGSSTILTRTAITPNGQATFYTVPRLTELDSANISTGLTRSGYLKAGAGDAFSGEFVKDAGNVNIELGSYTPATAGWTTVPSAALQVVKVNEDDT